MTIDGLGKEQYSKIVETFADAKKDDISSAVEAIEGVGLSLQNKDLTRSQRRGLKTLIKKSISKLPKKDRASAKKSSGFVLGRLGFQQRYRKNQFIKLAKEIASDPNGKVPESYKLLASSLTKKNLLFALREIAKTSGEGFTEKFFKPALEANAYSREDADLSAFLGQILYDDSLPKSEQKELVHATLGKCLGKELDSKFFNALDKELRNRTPTKAVQLLINEHLFHMNTGTDAKSRYAKRGLAKASSSQERAQILKLTFGPHQYDNKKKLLENLQGYSKNQPHLDKDDMKYLLDEQLISQELYEEFLPSTEHLPKYIIPQLKVAQTQNERNALLDKAFAGYFGNAIGDQLAKFLGESKEELSLTVEDLKYLQSKGKISEDGVRVLTEIFNNPPEDPTEYYNALVQAYKDIYPGR